MNTIEFFAGTKSFTKVAKELGHTTLTIDNDSTLHPDICCDIHDYIHDTRAVDVAWFSPPCEGFSVAAIGKNWNHDHTPKTESAIRALEIVKETTRIIEAINPKHWFIENPRGKLRKIEWFAEWVKRQGGTTHGHILPIWRYAHEAHGHLD